MNRLARNAALAYGMACYLIFFATFLYLVGFLGNLLAGCGKTPCAAGNRMVQA